MARLPVPTRDDIPEGQRETFDEIVERMGRVPQVGPEAAMIYVPEAHKWIAGLSNYLRFESALSMRTRELAILVTARELDCQHIWNAHAPLGRDNGVPDELITALRERRPLPAMSPGDAAVVYLGQEFFQTHKVSRGAFQSALGTVRRARSGGDRPDHGQLRPVLLRRQRLRHRPRRRQDRASAACIGAERSLLC